MEISVVAARANDFEKLVIENKIKWIKI